MPSSEPSGGTRDEYVAVDDYLCDQFSLYSLSEASDGAWPRLLPGIGGMGIVTLLSPLFRHVLPSAGPMLVGVLFLTFLVFVFFFFWMLLIVFAVHRAGDRAHIVDRMLIRYAGPVLAYLAVPICLMMMVTIPRRDADVLAMSCVATWLAVCELGLVLTVGSVARLRAYTRRPYTVRNLPVLCHVLAILVYMTFVIGVPVMYLADVLASFDKAVQSACATRLTIVTHPIDQAVDVGDRVTISVEADGVTMSTCWWFDKGVAIDWEIREGRSGGGEVVVSMDISACSFPETSHGPYRCG